MRRSKSLGPTPPLHVVVTLHGLLRTPISMVPLGLYLRKKGYEVLHFGYRSYRHPLEYHADQLRRFLLERVPEGARLSFVTHSMGAIVLRTLMASDPAIPASLHRAVFFGPPNQGAAIAKGLGAIWPFASLLGPSFRALSSLQLPTCAPNVLEIGVIAGDRGERSISLPFVLPRNDGIVAVEETRLEGVRDYLVLPALHSSMMWYPSLICCTERFLREGRFLENSEPSP